MELSFVKIKSSNKTATLFIESMLFQELCQTHRLYIKYTTFLIYL